MTTGSFDTLSCYKRLRSVGFTEQQAEVTAEALRAVVRGGFDTQTYTEKLREAGFTEQQIETMIEAFNTVLQYNRQAMQKHSEAA